MQFTQALQFFSNALLVTCLIGIITRCIQERLNPLIWPTVVFAFITHLICDLILPVVVSISVFLNKTPTKRSGFERIIWGILALPLGYMIIISEFQQSYDEKFWGPLNKLTHLKIHYDYNSLFRKLERTIVEYSRRFISNIDNKLRKV